MLVEILTPDQALFKGEATAVQLPGKDGLFQVLDHHAPIIATLAEGTVKIDLAGEAQTMHASLEADDKNSRIVRLQVKGGVVEMVNNTVIILAD
jgi:F-type H+-transporting ATPase subunit epsilon